MYAFHNNNYRPILIIVPSVIIVVVFIAYAVNSSIQIKTSKVLLRKLFQISSKSSPESSIILKDSTNIQNISEMCEKYNVSDTRPFFDQESSQTNLPQRISNMEHTLIRPQLPVVACAYNVESHVDNLRKHIGPIIDLFHPSSRIFMLESDSTDNTLRKLRQWRRVQIQTYGNLKAIIPKRTERIAYCRNKLLSQAREIQPDYMLVVDADIFSVNISSFLTNFEYKTSEWSVMTANLIENYYDIWALRTLSENILNYDVWHVVWAMQRISNYCPQSVRHSIINIHMKPLSTDRNLLEVRSAFGGAAIYKMEATKNCFYTGKPYTCEHVPFHLCMRDKNQARIFINPRFTNDNIEGKN
ncbi:hypothetical protein I4U23_018400 [Adineta vaga]|nr:hypothetical protein I4U23_018400 [Adineta vaga]